MYSSYPFLFLYVYIYLFSEEALLYNFCFMGV